MFKQKTFEDNFENVFYFPQHNVAIVYYNYTDINWRLHSDQMLNDWKKIMLMSSGLDKYLVKYTITW